MNELLFATLVVTSVLILVAMLDDLIVDLMVLWRRSDRIQSLPAENSPDADPPRVAVFVANWHEDDVLEAMVEGNLKRIDYPRFTLVLGVYPNDVATRAIAEGLERRHPGAVRVIVNRCAGPTSKGQMLNEMFARVFEDRVAAPDIVVLHDSEDVIAPRSFEIYAEACRTSAMVQIPVFSLDSRDRSIVGATYMEEFAERHTREMLLRAELGAFVPSAGVGTAIRKDLILHFLDQRGHVLQPGSVTEDYILGAEAHEAGFKTTFRALRNDAEPGAPIVATLEYFPKDFWASVRQKTRWVYGITFEGAKRIGWKGQRGWNLFFLYRDRKGAFANLLPLASFLLLLVGLAVGLNLRRIPTWQQQLLWPVLALNTIGILIRIGFKVQAFHAVYRERDLLGILLRWPVAIVVNAVAVARAWRTFVLESRLASRPIAWAKTRHELPALFGSIAAVGSGLQPALAHARRPALVRQARGAARYMLPAVALVMLVSFGSSFLRKPRTFTAEEHDAAGQAARSVLARIEEGERELVALAHRNSSQLPKLAWLDVDRTLSRSTAPIVGDRMDSLATAGLPAVGEATTSRAIAELAIARMEAIELAILRKSRRQSQLGDSDAAAAPGDGEAADAAADSGELGGPSTIALAREGREARRMATFSLASIDVEQWRIQDSARRRSIETLALLTASPEGHVSPGSPTVGVEDRAALEAADARRLAREAIDHRTDLEQAILSRAQPMPAKPSPASRDVDADEALRMAAADIARSEAVETRLLGVARERTATVNPEPPSPVGSAHSAAGTPAHPDERARDLGLKTAEEAAEALRLASQGIAAANANEADVLANAAANRRLIAPARPDQALVGTVAGASIGSLRPDHQDYARIIAALLKSEGLGSAASNTRGIATPTVRKAQAVLNRWLDERKLDLTDLVARTSKSPCGKRLCPDGILGPLTKATLQAVWQREEGFTRAESTGDNRDNEAGAR